MKEVVIVGGGSAGWMTASYLAYNNSDINITVISSSNIPTVGVGESTTPYLVNFLRSIGITKESEWMPYCNATYKNGVLYQDWDFFNSRWWHSFEVDEYKHKYWFYNAKNKGLDRQDYYASNMYSGVIGIRDSAKWLAKKTGEIVIPKYFSEKSQYSNYYGWPQNWAYHLDADLFGEFLKNHCLSKNNVKHLDIEINKIIKDENGINSIIGTNEEIIKGDLFVDCTGFKRLLINNFDEAEFVTFDPYLTHDKACVIRYDYLDKDSEMKPRTRTKALTSGWVWEIPLYDKISVGYVYTSKFISDEEAEFELRHDIGLERLKNYESFTIDIKTGYYKKPFIKNVVAVGLAAGFIEPLESTLLLAIQMAAEQIDLVLKNSMGIENYNKSADWLLHGFLDFISTNYYLSHRTDSEFWRSNGKNTQLTPRMKEWAATIETKTLIPQNTTFSGSSWYSKLIGFNAYIQNNENINPEILNEVTKLNNSIRNFPFKDLISQYEYLNTFIYNKF